MTDKPTQHTPVHLTDPLVTDKKHPAASSFAPVQPGAGVVADDADEKGQNLAGGQKASDAEKQYNAGDKVVEAHQGLAEPASTEAGGEAKQDVAKPATAPKTDKKS
jgi:hypothetical protein